MAELTRGRTWPTLAEVRTDSHIARVRRGLVVGLVLIAAAAVTPTAALAATVSGAGKNVVYAGAGNENNDVSVVLADGAYTITDPGATINPTAGCTTVGPSEATCPAAGVTSLRIQVNNGDDAVELSVPTPAFVIGGSGNDTLRGGSGDDLLDDGTGNDWVEGGGGNDSMVTRDAFADAVLCGDGTDSVTADLADVVAADCESIDVPSAGTPGSSPVGTPGGGSLTSPVLPAPSILRPTRPITVSTSGVVPLRLRCQAEAAARCTGTLTLETRTSARRASIARRGRRLVLGKVSFSIAPGRTARLKVRLTRRGRQLLRSNGRVRVTAQISRRGGPNLRPSSRTLTLKRKARRSRGRRAAARGV